VQRPRRIHFLGLLAVILVGYGIERLIVTDREAIEALAAETAAAIQAGDFEGLTNKLHAEFEYGDRDRDQTVAFVRTAVRKFRPVGTRIVLFEITVNGETATAAGQVTATVLGRLQQLRIDAVFRKGEEGWQIKEIRSGGLPR